MVTIEVYRNCVANTTLAETWEASIRFLLKQREMPIVDTDTGGATIEVEDMILRVSEPGREPRLSDRYVDPDLVDGFGDLFKKRKPQGPTDAATVADRIYAWSTSTGRNIDQFQKVVAELKANPASRRAIIQIWNPEQDLDSKSGGVPSGYCYFYFASRRSIEPNGQQPQRGCLDWRARKFVDSCEASA